MTGPVVSVGSYEFWAAEATPPGSQLSITQEEEEEERGGSVFECSRLISKGSAEAESFFIVILREIPNFLI